MLVPRHPARVIKREAHIARKTQQDRTNGFTPLVEFEQMTARQDTLEGRIAELEYRVDMIVGVPPTKRKRKPQT